MVYVAIGIAVTLMLVCFAIISGGLDKMEERLLAAVRGYSEQEQRKLDEIVGIAQAIEARLRCVNNAVDGLVAKRPVKRGK